MKWEMVKLGELCKFQYGNSLIKENRKETGTYPVYGSNGIVGFHDTYLVEKPCLIIGRKGSVGAVHYSETPCFPIDTTYYIVPEGIDIKYLYYQIKTLDLGSLEKSTSIPGLNRNDAYQKEIPLPPLTTQKRIAEILDKADALRQKDQALLRKYDELAQAVFMDMFGDPEKNVKKWEVKRIVDLCNEVVDCPHSTPIHTSIPTEYPCIRTSEMKNGKIKWSSMKYVDEQGYNERISRLKPQKDDIIYAREGTFGEAVLVPENCNMCLGQRTMLFRINRTICIPEFFWFQINTDYLYKQALKKTNGSTVGHINVKDIKEFNVIVPPINIQLSFTTYLTNILAQSNLLSIQCNHSESLFQSLLQKAFMGELVS